MLARSQHIPNIVQSDFGVLHTCCDVSEESLQICREQFNPKKTTTDFRAAIEDPEVDIIVLASTENFRVPPIEVAARAGKPLYTEKPVAGTWADALKIEQLVKESGIRICVGHNRRCSPAMAEGRRLFRQHMESGHVAAWRYDREGANKMDFGDRDGKAAISIRINDDWWSWKNVHLHGDAMEYGLLLGEFTHWADLSRWWMDAEAEEVTAILSGPLLSQVTIKFKTGELASVFSSGNGSFGYPKELLEAMGNGGVVVVDHMLEVRSAGVEEADIVKKFPMLHDRHPGVGTQGGVQGWLEKKQQACEEAAASGNAMDQFTAEPDKGHLRMLGEFVKEIRGEREPVSPVQDAVQAVKICFAAIKSFKEGRPVKIDEIQ